jgi:hypothetical protein
MTCCDHGVWRLDMKGQKPCSTKQNKSWILKYVFHLQSKCSSYARSILRIMHSGVLRLARITGRIATAWEYQESTTRIHRKLLDSRELGSRNKKAEMPAHLFMQIKQIIHCNNCFVARLDTEAERVLSFTWHHYLEPLWRLYALSRLDPSVWTCWRVQSPADHLGSCWISNSHTESHLSPIRYPGEDDENPEGALGCGSRTSSGAAAKPWNHGTHGTGSSHKIYQAQAAQISWNIVKLKWAGHSVPRVLVIGWYPFWIFFKKLRPSHLL